ncbi:MAG: hypothetical protein IAE79_03485 [Anaerolinea sp.]|nr:hypothetical protein [Anaerolinea sp.]
MDTPSLTKSQKIELLSIKEDTEFYRELILQLSSYSSSNVLIFGLFPYVSLYVEETFNYVQRTFPSVAGSLSPKYGNVIKSSRMRVKFFDDSKKRIDGMFELLAWISEFNTEWHIHKHKGFLSPLKRMLQKDLGLFGYNGHLFGSTHVGLLNVGYEEGDLPTNSKEISETLGKSMFFLSKEMGSYIGKLSDLFGVEMENASIKFFDYRIDDELLGYRDEKSFKFFRSVFNGTGTEDLNFTLVYFLVTVNYFQHILKHTISGSPPTLFKIKFITLYHLASSLKKLQNYFYPKNVLTERSKKYLKELLRDGDLKLLGGQSDFRNILVHYGLDGFPSGNIDTTLTLPKKGQAAPKVAQLDIM